MTDKTDLAAACADHVHAYLMKLHQDHGVPVDVLLAGAHAQVCAMMGAALGGREAAQIMRQAADTIEGVPSIAQAALAAATPAGHA